MNIMDTIMLGILNVGLFILVILLIVSYIELWFSLFRKKRR